MKIIILLFVFLFSLSINAQWEILNEGFKGRINTIDFVNENVGWIGGSNGILLKTNDSGENWNSIKVNESWDLNQIDFINDSLGWAIGSSFTSLTNTIIIKTADGGYNWTIQKKFQYIDLYSLYVIDEKTVYAAGYDRIYKTTNGGINWNDVSPNTIGRKYNSIQFINPDCGNVVGRLSYEDGEEIKYKGMILRTTNGGISWNETTVNEFNNITDLKFLDDTTGHFIANLDTNYFLCKTEDMCQTWEIVKQNPYPINTYQFLDKNTAYAIIGDCTTENNIMKTTDGGVTWQILQSLDINYFSLRNIIYFKKTGIGFILGNFLSFGRGRVNGYLSGFVFKSSGNDKWILQKFNYQTINDVYFINKDKGILAGGFPLSHGSMGGLFSTTDGGKTWNITYVQFDIFQSCSMINETEGFSLSQQSGIYKTTDSGNSWNHLYTNNVDSTGVYLYANDICFIDEKNGFVVGSEYPLNGPGGAAILTTKSSALSWKLEWKKTDSIFYPGLNSICNVGTTCWTVGERGMVVKYNPQSGWVEQIPITDLPLKKVFFIDDDHGWIAGGYKNETGFQSILLRTKNGGVNWEANKNQKYLVNDLWFTSNQHGWAVGCDLTDKGVILESKDGGDSWTVAVDNLLGPLNSIFIKENYAWAVGEYGLILRTTDAGITWIDDNNDKLYPTEFKLEQNYPNPFNPSTIIKYTIPDVQTQNFASVRLVIYDILGREVATLVNEKQKPGNYEVEWDAGKNSTGIYFYRITAGIYSNTKKMILLK